MMTTGKDTSARIMIVDDEPMFVDMLGNFLQTKGLTAERFHNPEKAMAAIIAKNISLVLLDILMPEINGLKLLKRIKNIAPSVRVIVVSAQSDPEVARECLQLGASDYIAKPVDLEYFSFSVMAELLMA